MSEKRKNEKIDYQPKKGFFNRIYLSELSDQCHHSLLSMAYLRFALSTANTDLVFYSAHAFLSHVGNISKLLWPDIKTKRSMPKTYKRDKELKLLLNIPENSPLKDRLFRNHYEHFDSRIDEWVFSSEHHNFIQKFVGPLTGIGGINTGDIMKHFDPNTFVLTFRGDIYDLRAAEKEVIILIKKIRQIDPTLS